MKSKLLGLMAIVPLLGLSPANASTYNVNFFLPSSTVTPFVYALVTGTIATDCDLCTLGLSDLGAWSFTYTGPGSMNGTFSGNNSNISMPVAGTSPLSAGGGNIQYAFTATGEFEFLFVTGGAENDELIVGPNELVAELDCSGCEVYDTPQPAGGFQFATEVAGTATPLPAALPLFGTGLGVMGLFGWRRKRKAASLTAV
jgi:hypothetical protein